jgi:ATP-dependent Lon protease
MSTSHSAEPLPFISKQEYYSSLPWFRRCLAMLNWRPVVDYELREIEFDRKEIEYKQREIAHEQRMKQLQIEEQQRQIAHEQRMKQLESEIAQIEKETAQLDELNSKIDALLFSSSTSSSPHQSTPDSSEA